MAPALLNLTEPELDRLIDVVAHQRDAAQVDFEELDALHKKLIDAKERR